ncbi:hypothetical protein H9L19_07485 [Weissella diestrammenae]|uniref:Uncharacterized protein n=1 Tax=Weissella diestrammenae TaxID=1162633 RepID=A0A7G9T524_9LACO|nr:hypothetical protein [Weissella diestrammenae]MCM0582922.1 hypothetical protein [Weissella diestrammenae]QNN75199.1 hypothetical protein H9L19_07485 [Weissella diestrammenae]
MKASKKILCKLILIIVAVGGAYKIGTIRDNRQDQASSSHQVELNSSKKAKSNVTSKDTDKNLPDKSSSSFLSGGEASEASSELETLMKSTSGISITKENVQEARNQIRAQGINDGDFSDLDIAKVIDKANQSSLDYKSAIKSIYPHYFD